MDQTGAFIEVVLIGDTGLVKTQEPDSILELLRMCLPTGKQSAIIFLGDLVYPRGLPPSNHPQRHLSEARLRAQLDVLKDFPGKRIFIPGNHDWNKGRKGGLEYVLRQQQFIERYFNTGQTFYLPGNGTPGPSYTPLSDYAGLIVFDIQWWMQRGMREQSNLQDQLSEQTFFATLETLLNEHRHKRLLLCAHLPIYTYGKHGGRYGLGHHVFPFTIYHKNWFVPVPGVGSVIPLYRMIFGAREDLAHPRYRRFRALLKPLLRKHQGLIYASGHEHTLQYIYKNENHFIVSGAGSKMSFVNPGKNARYTSERKGFFLLRMYADLRCQLECWTLRPQGGGEVTYQCWLA